MSSRVFLGMEEDEGPIHLQAMSSKAFPDKEEDEGQIHLPAISSKVFLGRELAHIAGRPGIHQIIARHRHPDHVVLGLREQTNKVLLYLYDVLLTAIQHR